MHLEPSYGKSRKVGGAILSTMFPAGDDGRILVTVAGTNGKIRQFDLSHILGCNGLRVGMTNSDQCIQSSY